MKHDKREGKATSLKFHAQKRFQERFGETISGRELRELATHIRRNGFKRVGKLTLRQVVFQGVVKGHDTNIVYDKIRKCVVTFLPLDYKLNLRSK